MVTCNSVLFAIKLRIIMTTIRYARVKSTITDENSDDNTNQLQTIDSEEEDDEVDVLSVKIASCNNDDNHASLKHSTSVRNTLLKTVLWVGLLICCHYILSIGLTFYQRWLLKVRLFRNFRQKSIHIFFFYFSLGLQISFLSCHLSFNGKTSHVSVN